MDFLIDKGWYFLLAAVIGEMIIPFILAPFYQGYSHTTMVISALGNAQSPVRLPFNLWMLVAGVLFLLSTPAVYNLYRGVSKPLSAVTVLFIGIFSVGACIVTCFFSVNESRDIVTTASQIHGAGSAIGFTLMLFVPLFMAILAYKSADSVTGTVATASFVVALICFALFIMADKQAFQHTVIAKEGLWQRLNLLFLYLPLGFAALTKIKFP